MLTLPNYQIDSKIYESANSVVYRGIRNNDNQSVILKVLKEDYPTLEELTRYRQEYNITNLLTEVDGIVKAYHIEKYQNTLVICLEDFGGESLRIWQQQRTFTFEELLQFSIQVTEILGQIHRQHIIHKDINPSNLIVNPTTGVLKIIDFGIATQLSKQHLALKNPEVLEGTLAYMSPEQTGRMNRALDYRSDFYSLGATFYELFTNQLPFETTDAMELVHCHIAKQPIPPHQVNPDLPPILSQIILKLLEKTAEARYQSAWGLKADLQKLQENLLHPKYLTNLSLEKVQKYLPGFKSLASLQFELAQQDICEHFEISQKLYGRETEINTLLAAFERVAAGTAEIMLIAGYSGIGKSVLVKEIYQSLTEKQGYFISGKFDQFQRNIPYSALINAFKELVQQLLTENEQQLLIWQEKLLAALAPNAQIIIEVLPELEWIIGQQPPVAQLGPAESQNRFSLVFQNLMRVFCQPEHPLVLFLDDLQWIDSVTLKLLELIIIDLDNTSLFLIGAYRDNEIEPTHPLIMTLAKLIEKNVIINQITLKQLSFGHLNQLIADSLHHDLKTVSRLTDLVMRKTGGNPFFVNQFLHTLYQEDLLRFLPSTFEQKAHWQWDIAQIEAINITDNVVDLMIGKLKKLPESAQQILRLAACVGNHFDLDTLAIIYEKSLFETFQDLMSILTEELILPASSLKLNNEKIHASQPLIHHFCFLHERVQQAAYTLIDEEQKKAVHLQIGRLLLKNTPIDKLEEKVFDIIGHFNGCLELLDDQDECYEIAKLNLMAGQKAKEATAYAAAREYLQQGINWLPENSWVSHYSLTLALHREMGEVEYLNGHYEQSEQLIYLTIDKTQSILEKVEIYALLIGQYTLLNKYQQAIESGKRALTLLDVELPESNFQAAIKREMVEINQQLGEKTIASLIELPEMTIPKILMIVKLLTQLFVTAFVSNHTELHAFLCCRLINLYLKHGHTYEAAEGYAVYGMLEIAIAGNHQRGYEFGLLGIKIAEKFNYAPATARAFHVFALFLNHWIKPIKHALPISDDAYKAAFESGELDMMGYITLTKIINPFYQGQSLVQTLQEIEQFMSFIYKIQHQFVADILLAFQLISLNLTGQTKTRLDFHNDEQNEAQYLNNCQNNQNAFAMCIYHVLKSMELYLYGELTEAYQHAEAAEKLLLFLGGIFTVAEHNFYSSLILIALYQDDLSDTQKWEKLIVNQKQMECWATNCPENFHHKYLLVQAEMARLERKPLEEVMELYDQSIIKARENDFLHNEALANELTARFWLERGKQEFAQIYLTKAHYGYQQWGAQCKIEILESQYPQLRVKKTATSPILTNATFSMTRMVSSSTENSANLLDLNSVMKAAQTLSGEIVLSRLLKKMMLIVIENAGAEKGFLLLPQQEQWFIEATAHVYDNEIEVLQSIPIDNQQIAESIIYYVARTKENVVLNNASAEGQFSRDAHIISQSPQSVLCAALLNQGKLTGILYLENNLTAGAFTPERLQVLQIISSQLAISIENALLYRTLEQKVERRTAQLAQANKEITTLNKQLKSENLRMSAELDISRQLQQMLLPKDEELKAIDDLDIAGFMEPADEVGGDYYDVLQHAGRTLFAIGDVTGHGLASGALAIMVQSAVRTLLAYDRGEPIHFLNALNQMVFHNVARMNTEKTLTLALISYRDRQLFLTGQHEEIIVVRQGELALIDTMELGFPIGLEKDIANFVDQVTIPLNIGDVVVLYTDGITEAENLEGELYGLERLCDIIRQHWQQTAQEIQQAVIKDVRVFIGEQRIFDDITLLVLKQK